MKRKYEKQIEKYESKIKDQKEKIIDFAQRLRDSDGKEFVVTIKEKVAVFF